MITCTIILALLTVLIATETDPAETAPAPEEKSPTASPTTLANAPRRADPAVETGQPVILRAGKFRFDRQSRLARVSLPFPSTHA